MSILSLMIIAMLGESVWESLKMAWQSGKFDIDRIGAIGIGLILSFATGFDILKLVDIPVKIPYVGIVLTGILISRGANFVHDLLSKVQDGNNSNSSLPKM